VATGPVEVRSADIARIAGVKPAAVSNWRRRHGDFPKPVNGTDRSPLFNLAQVESWLRSQGRTKAVSASQRLWQAFDSARGAMAAEDALAAVGTLLLHQRLHPDVTLPTEPAALIHLLREADRSFAHLETAGIDVAGRRPHVDSDRLTTLLFTAADAVRDARSDSENPASEIFELLCSRFLETVGRAGFMATPPQLAALMVRLAGAPAGMLLDPACGSGTILLAAADLGYQRVLGQEVNGSMARIAALRLALRDSAEGSTAPPVRAGDSLRRPARPHEVASAVVLNPPFADRNWGYDRLAGTSVWDYGVPTRMESELAWVQHALAQVVRGGAVVMLVPPGVAFRPSGRRIRRELLTRGALRGVISLPLGLAAHYSQALQIWILRNPAEHATPGHLLVIDTAGEVGTARLTDGTDATPVWARICDLAIENWQKFRVDPEGFTDVSGVARAVPLVELLDEAVDLTPRRHLPQATTPGLGGDELLATRDQLSQLLATLGETLPGSVRLPEVGQERVRAVALSELAKTGAVFIRRTPTPGSTGMADEGCPAPTTEGRILTGADIVAGVPPSGAGEVDGDEVRNPPIRSGDVLVPLVARRLTARVATEQDVGAYPASTVYVVRTDPAVLEPWFLAGYLSSGDGGRQAERMSSSGGDVRVDLRRVRLPLLPIDTQRAYGQVFQRLAEFARNLRAAHDLGLDLVRNSTDAIVLGLGRAIEVGSSVP
jgi:hypothetical protein